MPKLLFLLPCRTFANDGETGSLTIAEVIDQVTVNIPAGGNIQSEGVVSAPWAVVNLWQREASDVGKQFEQRITLVAPSGKPLMNGNNPFELQALKHRMTLRVNGFPVAGPGTYLLKIECRTLPGGDWEAKGEYPVEVVIAPQ
jgi:hypothetical protein